MGEFHLTASLWGVNADALSRCRDWLGHWKRTLQPVKWNRSTFCKVVIKGCPNEKKYLPWRWEETQSWYAPPGEIRRSCPSGILQEVSQMKGYWLYWYDGALWSVFWPVANEGSGEKAAGKEIKTRQTSGRLINQDFRWNLPVVEQWERTFGELSPHAGKMAMERKKISVWRRWKHLGQLSKPIWTRSAGQKCREPEISAAESHRSASSQFSLVRSDMKRLLYYRFILSGFTPWRCY